MGNTYIEVTSIDEEGIKGTFGIKIGMLLRPEVTALEFSKHLLAGYDAIVDAKFITEDEYNADYGNDDE